MLEKWARLGVDVCGGTDAGVRHVLEPIERLVREEYPQFDPPPFGQQQWIHVLIRHILLAEPMVDDFARCFSGIGVEEAQDLADCFSFEQCVVREPLAAALRDELVEHSGGQGGSS